MLWWARAAAVVVLAVPVVAIADTRRAEPGTTIDPVDAARGAAVDSEIVFARITGGNRELHAMTTNGRPLGRRVGEDAAQPAWSPDGRTIAFSRMSGEGRDTRSSIWTTAADGSAPRQLTTDAEFHLLPSWAPDGKRLAFEAWTDRGIRIAVVSADGGQRRIVTRGSQGGAEPDFSHAGRSIVFVRQRRAESDLWVIRADGTNQRRLVTVPGDAANPAWSPDGRWIAFGGNGGGSQFHVYLIRRDGKRLRKLVRGGQPDWSPDGRQLVFASQRDGDPEIFMARRDGTHQRKLTDNRLSDMYPKWRPATAGSTADRSAPPAR